MVLSLVDKKGNPSAGRLSIRVTQESASIVAGDAVEQAQTSAQGLALPLATDVSDAVTNISNTQTNQRDLITSFDALMQKLGVLVKVGDEVAKVRSLYLLRCCNDLNHSTSKDTSLRQFCVASDLRGVQSKPNSNILVPFETYIFE